MAQRLTDSEKKWLINDPEGYLKAHPDKDRNTVITLRRYYLNKKEGKMPPRRNPEQEPQPRGRKPEELGATALSQLITEEDRKALHTRLDEVLDEANINPAHVKGFRVNAWDMGYVDSDGEAQAKRLRGIQLVAEAKDFTPEWPVIQSAEKQFRLPKFERNTQPSERGTALIMPDNQIHYWMLQDGTIEPFHDVSMHALGIQLMTDLKPDVCVGLGDLLDFPNHSKYIQTPTFAFTQNRAIQFAYNFLAMKRGVSPKTHLVEIQGNHDNRPDRYAKENAMASMGIRRADLEALADKWPVMTVPHLLRFDELGIEYVDGYPAAGYWLMDNLLLTHEPMRKNDFANNISNIHGHLHRIYTEYETKNDRNGGYSRIIASPGTMSRIDGYVPSTKGAVDLSMRPIKRYENWQHGFMVVEYDRITGAFDAHPIRVDTYNNYQTRFNGKTYTPDPALVAEMESWGRKAR